MGLGEELVLIKTPVNTLLPNLLQELTPRFLKVQWLSWAEVLPW